MPKIKLSTIVSYTSWASFFVLAWLVIFGVLEFGTIYTYGLIAFITLGVLSGIASQEAKR